MLGIHFGGQKQCLSKNVASMFSTLFPPRN
jgi:hypothetical protein